MNLQQIYNALDYDWWADTEQTINGPTFQTANIYFQDGLGNWHYFCSNGPCPENPDGSLDNPTREQYVKGGLMWDTARQLLNGQCEGGITNIKPAGYRPQPIYFK